MTNTQLTFQEIEAVETSSDSMEAGNAAPSEMVAGARSQKILIDGVEYDATNITAAAKGAIASLQFAEAMLRALQNELAICHTAQFAYVKSLKAEMEGKES